MTTPARTLADLAPVLPERVLRRAVREAEVQRLADCDAVRAQLRPGRAGAARLRALIDLGPAPTRSELEDRTLDLLARHGFPRPRVNATVQAGGRAWEVDFLFCDLRLIVEADGQRYHSSWLARERDMSKQAVLEAAGFRVVRVTWRQVVEQPDQTAGWLRQVMQAEAARRR